MPSNDIHVIDSGNPINNGGATIKVQGTGYQTVTGRPINTPVIADIQGKFDARFNHPRYYSGDTDN